MREDVKDACGCDVYVRTYNVIYIYERVCRTRVVRAIKIDRYGCVYSLTLP